MESRAFFCLRYSARKYESPAPSSLKVPKKYPSKQSSSKIQLKIIQDLILHLNDEKCQTLTMLQSNVIHLDTRKILIFNNSYILRDNVEKKWWQDLLSFTTRDRLIDQLFSYDQAILLSEVCGCLQDYYYKYCRGLLFAVEQGLEYDKVESKSIVFKFLIHIAYVL